MQSSTVLSTVIPILLTAWSSTTLASLTRRMFCPQLSLFRGSALWGRGFSPSRVLGGKLVSSFCQDINEQESQAHELLWGQMKSCFWGEKACISLDQKWLIWEEQSHPGAIFYLIQEMYLVGQQDSNSKWISPTE